MSVHRSNGRFVIKFREGGCSRSLTVSRKNLLSFGLASPATEKAITKRHAKALDAEVERQLLLSMSGPRPPEGENLRIAAELFLDQLHVSEQHRQNKKRWLLGANQAKPRTRKCLSLAERFGDLPVHSITTDHIAELRQDLATVGYQAHTVVNALRTVRSFFNWCVATRRCETNPARPIPLPSAEPDVPAILTPDEVQRVLKAAKGKRIERPFRLILGLGLRREEAQALQWEDIDPDKRVVVIRRRLKTRRARREIPLPFKLWKFLAPPNGSNVLSAKTGEPCTDSALCTMLARFKEATSFPFNVTYRICRATYGSFLIAKGFELAEVSRFLGHSSISITERWYYGLRPSRYVDRIDRAFSAGYL